jgi:hypothetical protein
MMPRAVAERSSRRVRTPSTKLIYSVMTGTNFLPGGGRSHGSKPKSKPKIKKEPVVKAEPGTENSAGGNAQPVPMSETPPAPHSSPAPPASPPGGDVPMPALVPGRLCLETRTRRRSLKKWTMTVRYIRARVVNFVELVFALRVVW